MSTKINEPVNNSLSEKSVLNVQVSFFNSYRDTIPRTIQLLDFLTKQAYTNKIKQIRETEDKIQRDKLKSQIGAITPSGIFSERNANALLMHTGLIQFDIDQKDNAGIGNYQELKKEIIKIPNVAYCGLSVSGTGYWGLIPIKNPLKHREHFNALHAAFNKLGISIDISCKDVSRLRGYSFDPDAYFNHNAAIFYYYERETAKTKIDSQEDFKKYPDNKMSVIQKVLGFVEESKLDITGNYATWFKIGCSLAGTFGENGREMFHKVSYNYSGYCAKETDVQFDNCLKGNGIKFGTFIFYCKEAGIPEKLLKG